MNNFDLAIRETLPAGLNCYDMDTLQINMGRRCNLSCAHCHLECSPLRRELMTEQVMESIIDILSRERFRLVDITGGAPELHPKFREFVDGIRRTGSPVQVRTNLTVLLETGMQEMIRFFRGRQIDLVASLPCYREENVDSQRGQGVYARSIAAIRALNGAGYGVDPGLALSLVFNPGGPFLPPPQRLLDADYRTELDRRFGIAFTRMIVLTNMPVGRFKRRLEQNGELEGYLQLLASAYNPATLPGLMCRHQICIDWDGTLFDCDFNLALGMSVNHGTPDHVSTFVPAILKNRKIVTGAHCFGCTAGAGSSCSGALMEENDPTLQREAP
jgi:radical SAM/Cys-rich protein